MLSPLLLLLSVAPLAAPCDDDHDGLLVAVVEGRPYCSKASPHPDPGDRKKGAVERTTSAARATDAPEGAPQRRLTPRPPVASVQTAHAAATARRLLLALALVLVLVLVLVLGPTVVALAMLVVALLVLLMLGCVAAPLLLRLETPPPSSPPSTLPSSTSVVVVVVVVAAPARLPLARKVRSAAATAV